MRAGLTSVLSTLGNPRMATALVLPDGVARTALLDVPPATVVSEYVAFRLGSMLPYPVSEAIVGFRRIDGRRVLGAAMRRDIVAGYEALVRSVGVDVAAVEFAPFVALAPLQRATQGIDFAASVHVGDAVSSIALLRRGALLAFRSRRRASGPGEHERVREDVLRLAAAAGFAGRPRVLVVGSGGRELLGSDGWFELAPLGSPVSWDRPWLDGVIQ